MVSKSDLLIGALVLINSQIMLQFTPTSGGGGGMLAMRFGMETGHYVGGALGILFGIIGLALCKKVNKVTIAVSVLSILLGLVFVMDAPNGPLMMSIPMASIAELTLVVGIIGIIGSAILKPKK
jgi:nitrate/nitrite transporter NarK